MGVKVIRPRGKKDWYVQVCHGGRRKLRHVGSREAAFAVKRDIEEEIGYGAFNLNPPDEKASVTFEEYAEKWLEGHVRNNLKPSTYRGYKLLLDDHILPVFGARRIMEITRDEIKALCYKKLEEGRKKPIKREDGTVERRLSARSVCYIVRTLSAIFGHAIEDGILSANPAARPGRFIKTGGVREKVDFLTSEEGKRLLGAAQTHHAWFYPLLLTALRTGMRQGEIIALQWGDIDWNSKFIEVRRANWNGHVAAPKSGKSRRVDMSDQLASVLSEHRRKISAQALKSGRQVPEWVFPSETWTALDAANLRKTFLAVLKKAKLRHIRFHDLRHSFASWLLGNGESPTYVREQLGHHSIQITVDIYGHLIPGANRQAVNRLDDPPQESAPDANQVRPGSRVEQVQESAPSNNLLSLQVK